VNKQTANMKSRAYYKSSDRSPSTRFGLFNDQICGATAPVVKNATWLNAAGEKMGFGDLSATNIAHIAEQLEEGETFIACIEAMFWEAVDTSDEMFPTPEAIAKHARVIITPGRVEMVVRDVAHFDESRLRNQGCGPHIAVVAADRGSVAAVLA
jgi:hypothetical protein